LDNDQSITICEVISHHQNGIAERKIKDLTFGAQTILLHTKQMLPEYISTILWPFALKCTEDWMNNLVHRADGRTPYQALTGLDPIKLDVSNFHTFGWSCYVLDHYLQSGNSIVPKWEPQAQMGLYVGGSPSHAANVSMIFNPHTGHVSPQFHVVVTSILQLGDYKKETEEWEGRNEVMMKTWSEWKQAYLAVYARGVNR
jgi:hypothetical protein